MIKLTFNKKYIIIFSYEKIKFSPITYFQSQVGIIYDKRNTIRSSYLKLILGAQTRTHIRNLNANIYCFP